MPNSLHTDPTVGPMDPAMVAGDDQKHTDPNYATNPEFSGTMSNYTPSMSDRIAYWLAEAGLGDTREGVAKAKRVTDLLNMTPAGVATSAYDVGRNVGEEVDTLSSPFAEGPNARNMLGAGGSALAMFGGPMARTANLQKRGVAMLMEAKGYNPDSILQQTGWFKGPEGRWKFEISDAGATMINPKEPVKSLGDILHHPELYAAYPELAQMPVGVDRGLVGTNIKAYYEGFPERAIAYHPETLTDSTGALRGTLHELSHAVANIENFSPGSTTDPAHLLPGSPAYNIYWQMREKFLTPISLAEYARLHGLSDQSPITRHEHAHYLAIVEQARENGIPQSIDSRLRQRAARKAYDLSAGEAEARNVETRWHTGVLPQDAPPWDTVDVPFSKQIVEPPWKK